MSTGNNLLKSELADKSGMLFGISIQPSEPDQVVSGFKTAFQVWQAQFQQLFAVVPFVHDNCISGGVCSMVTPGFNWTM